MKTAVEYLIEQLSNYDSKMIELFGKEINKAKEMENQQTFDIMQQYASFCVQCDREKLPLVFAKEWFEQFKNK